MFLSFFVLLFRLDLAVSLFFQANCIWLKQNGQGDSVPNRQSSSNPSRFMLCAKIRKIIYNAPNKISFLTSVRYKESLCENLYIELAFPNVHDTCQTLTLQHGGTGHFHLVPLFFLRRAWQVAANAHRADKVSDTVCIITRTPCAYYFRHGRHVWVSTLWDFGGERAQKAYPRFRASQGSCPLNPFNHREAVC